ncbi:MAG: acylphosphatase [Nitrososphaerales archaeon]
MGKIYGLRQGKEARLKASQVIVRGEVQHVGYRRRVSNIARRIGVKGYVKNLSDGSVKIVVQGDQGLLDKFIKALKIEEPPILVDRIDAKQIRVGKAFRDFRIISGSFVEELQEGLGAGEAQLYMFRNEFRDYRNEFRDFTKSTDENFMRLESRYGEISEKLTAILYSQQKISSQLVTMFETFQKESIETRTQLIRAVDSLADLIKSKSSGAP